MTSKTLALVFFWNLICLTGCSQINTLTPTPITPESAKDFLEKYNWTVLQKLAEYDVLLPSSFEHKPGDFPIAIYWAYNNEFSKAIGLDLKPYLGKFAKASIFSLQEDLPEFLNSSSSARGIVITYEGKIIGAWVDQGRHVGFACSLNNQSFEEVTQLTWSQWLVSAGVVNLENETEKQLATLSPDEVITIYFAALDSYDFSLAYATWSRKKVVKYLFTNMDANALFNNSFSGWQENVMSVKLLSVENIWQLAENKGYIATVNVKYKDNTRSLGSEELGFCVRMTKEIDSLGWRIDSILLTLC